MPKTKARKPKPLVLLQLYARAKAPCRDYYGLTVGEKSMSLNIWKITHGPHLQPKEKRCPLEDLPYDKFLQEEISNVFGQSVCQYMLDLGNNQRRLENMPNKLFLNILKYLGPGDIMRLAQTSKVLRELCNTELIWCTMFRKVMKRSPTAEEKRMAFDYGWKEVLKMRTLLLRRTSENKLKTKASTTQVKKKLSTASLPDRKKPLPPPPPPTIKSKRSVIKIK